MTFGTIDRTPPPFFRQGPSALTKLLFFSALAVFLMVADARFRALEPLRAALAVVLLPVQRALAVPVDVMGEGFVYLQGLRDAREDERVAREQLTAQSLRASRVEALERENSQLRQLLDLQPAVHARTHAAGIIFEAADPYSRKVIIDQGASQGLMLGSPVINEDGVLGQLTRLFPNSAEVTLLADKDAAVPVLNTRTQQRGAAFGGSGIELRFTSANADVEVGDTLVTSGLDGVYPGGLPVARVSAIERRMESGFARISLTPAARPDGVRHVLVLEPIGVQLPPEPEPEAAPEARADRLLKTPRRAVSRSGASAPAAPAARSASP